MTVYRDGKFDELAVVIGGHIHTPSVFWNALEKAQTGSIVVKITGSVHIPIMFMDAAAAKTETQRRHRTAIAGHRGACLTGINQAINQVVSKRLPESGIT